MNDYSLSIYGKNFEFAPWGREGQEGYFTIILPSTVHALESKWGKHRHEVAQPVYHTADQHVRGGSWEFLSVGSFKTEALAVGWAKENLEGAPYFVHFFPV